MDLQEKSLRVFRPRQEPGTTHLIQPPQSTTVIDIDQNKIPRDSQKHEPNIFLVVSIMRAILSSDRMLHIQQHLLSPFATPSLNHNIRHVKSPTCNKDSPGTSRDATVQIYVNPKPTGKMLYCRNNGNCY